MQTPSYTIYACGTNAITLCIGNRIDEAVHAAIMQLHYALQQKQIPGVKDIIPAYHSITIVYDAWVVRKALQTQSAYHTLVALLETTLLEPITAIDTNKRSITIPVCYDESLGVDINSMAATKGMTIDAIITMHTNRTYHVYMLGFLPGFPYMGSVDEKLATPRLAQPRTKVAAGSVGIAGTQTGIYPFDSPGGWNIIGQTPVEIFSGDENNPTLLLPGDKVQFQSISLDQFHSIKNAVPKKTQHTNTATGIKVLKAGIADSIRDTGRFGYQHMGINPTAAMDKIAAQTANILVGNNTNEAVIELHYPAGSFLVETNCLLAISGADFTAMLDDEPITLHKPFLAKRSSILTFNKPTKGNCTYLAVMGGFDIGHWLGSYTTNLPAANGGYLGRYLKSGDHLGIQQKAQQPKSTWTNWLPNLEPCYTSSNIRVIKGPMFDALDEASAQRFTHEPFTISNQSNAMGFTLIGAALKLTDTSEQISSAVVMGTIQLLPNGSLLVLMADHQTTGGYPVIAYVIASDLPSLAQKKAGSSFSFNIITIETAEDLYCKQVQYLQQLHIACRLKMEY